MIDDIGKEAITVHEYIDEVIHDVSYNEHNIPRTKMKLVKKVINKFLDHMKKSKYYEMRDKWKKRYYDDIVNHLDRKEDHSTSVYLTWIQYQIHSFIRDIFPSHYDGCHGVVVGKFYKPTLERLMR